MHYLLILYIIIDLVPGETYTVYISSENAITDQVPEEQISIISASLIVSTEPGNLPEDHFTNISTTLIVSTEEGIQILLIKLMIPV